MTRKGSVARVRRRTITDVVTNDAMERFASGLNSGFSMLLKELPAPNDDVEERRRILVFQETGQLLRRAALPCLKEFHAEHYESIVRAAIRYTRDRLRNRPAEFAPTPHPRGELPRHPRRFLMVGDAK